MSRRQSEASEGDGRTTAASSATTSAQASPSLSPARQATAPSPSLSSTAGSMLGGEWRDLHETISYFDDASFFDLVGTDWKNTFRSLTENTRSRARHHSEKLKSIVRQQRHAIERKLKQPTTLKSRDKLIFTLGVTNVWATALMVGLIPHLVPWVYMIKCLTLLTWRIVAYRRRRWHYFMADMCYYVNALLMVYLLYPFEVYSAPIFLGIWGLSNGPVLIAIPTWKNSLVFHSLDKITSLFIHLEPPVVLFVLRHLLPLPDAEQSRVLHVPFYTNSFTSLFYSALLFYMLWQLLYHVLITIRKAEKIRAGHATSATYMAGNTKSIMYRICKLGGPGNEGYLFIAVQLIYTVITVIPTIFFFYSMTLHALMLIMSMMIATWNGANFYFEIFSSRYMEDLKKMEKELAALDARSSSVSTSQSPQRANNENVSEKTS